MKGLLRWFLNIVRETDIFSEFYPFQSWRAWLLGWKRFNDEVWKWHVFEKCLLKTADFIVVLFDSHEDNQSRYFVFTWMVFFVIQFIRSINIFQKLSKKHKGTRSNLLAHSPNDSEIVTFGKKDFIEMFLAQINFRQRRGNRSNHRSLSSQNPPHFDLVDSAFLQLYNIQGVVPDKCNQWYCYKTLGICVGSRNH